MVIGSFDSCTIVHVVYFEQIFAELNRNKIVKFIELDFIKKTFDFSVWNTSQETTYKI